MHQDEEVTELVGLCLWDIFSDNHEVITAVGRLVNIRSFRGAGAFLDEHLTRQRDDSRDGGYLPFCMGTIWISGRADLTPVYAMILRRLKAPAADWTYRFPELGLLEFASAQDPEPSVTSYSVSDCAIAEMNVRQRRAEPKRVRADPAEANARAREDAMDRPPPATVQAYRQVYRRDRRG